MSLVSQLLVGGERRLKRLGVGGLSCVGGGCDLAAEPYNAA